MCDMIPSITRSFIKLAALVAAFVLVVGATTAARAQDDAGPGQFVAAIDVPAGLSKEDVQGTIVMVLSSRAWALKAKEDGKVVGYLKHRSNEATVTLTYDDKKISLYCVGYEINKKTGERKKPELPNGWLNNIKGDLNKRLNQATAQK